jgi:hypothetical protein
MSNYTGNDNYGKPKQNFLDELAKMDEGELRKTCNTMIWLSAYANNNPRSDYHWQCDACYDECHQRGKVDIYSEEHAKLVQAARGR